MIVHIKELFPKQSGTTTGTDPVVGHFAYPALNTQNLETTLGIVAGAEELGVPIILQVSEGSIKYGGITTMYEIMATVAKRAKVPIALHMDHGKDEGQLKQGIALGFSSVMIDHSSLSLEENLRDTKAMVEFAHSHGAWVQGEIGKIRGNEDWVSVSDNDALLTEPEEAQSFASATGVDTLACSVGTIHGMIKISGGATPHVDVPRIGQIFAKVGKPLVLHGASGLDVNITRSAIANGIAIINIDSEIRLAFGESLRASLKEQTSEVDPRKIFKPVIEAIKQTTIRKLQEFETKNVLTFNL